VRFGPRRPTGYLDVMTLRGGSIVDPAFMGAFGSLLCFLGQAPSGQALSMQSVVVWLCGNPESG
jgi:hypothetical protein